MCYASVAAAAGRCPPCQKFTPMLMTAYNGLKASGKTFEVVFVSSDRDQGSFDGYYSKMPWLALPFEKRALKQTLSKKYKVTGTPITFVFQPIPSSLCSPNTSLLYPIPGERDSHPGAARRCDGKSAEHQRHRNRDGGPKGRESKTLLAAALF